MSSKYKLRPLIAKSILFFILSWLLGLLMFFSMHLSKPSRLKRSSSEGDTRTQLNESHAEPTKNISNKSTVTRNIQRRFNEKLMKIEYWWEAADMKNIRYITKPFIPESASQSKIKVNYATQDDDSGDIIWNPQKFLRKLEIPSSKCRKLKYLGGKLSCGFRDGHKYVCFDPDVAPKTYPNPNVQREKFYDKYKQNGKKQEICRTPSSIRLVQQNNIRGSSYTNPIDFSSRASIPSELFNERPNEDDRCIVYSFGIATDLSFDVAISQYGCRVYSFDMTIKNSTNNMVRHNLNFVRLGIDAEAHDIRMTMFPSETKILASIRPLEEIVSIFDHTSSTIDVLKVDIEYTEWKVFEDLLGSKEGRNILRGVKQIALEIHLDGLQNSSSSARVAAGIRYEKVLDQLADVGYHLVYTFLNQFSQVHADVRRQVFPLYRESLYVRRLDPSSGKITRTNPKPGKQ